MIWAYVEFLLRSPYTIYLIDEQETTAQVSIKPIFSNYDVRYR